jgi:hypothetical protein
MKVYLKYHGIGRFAEPAFSIADNPLELDFEGIKGLSGEFILLYRINSQTEKKIALRACKTTIPIEELKAGQLDGKVIHCVRGIKVSEYDIEPLVLKDIDGKFFAHGMLTDIENTVAGLVKTTRAQSEEIKELKTALAEEIKAKEEVLAKMKAYADNGAEVTF